MAGGAAGKNKGAKGKNFKGFGIGRDGEKKEERMPHERKSYIHSPIITQTHNLLSHLYTYKLFIFNIVAGKTDKDIKDPDTDI